MAKKTNSGGFWGKGGRSWWDDDDSFDSNFGKGSGSHWKSTYSYSKDKTNIVDPVLDWFTKSDVRWGVKQHIANLPKELQELYNQGVVSEEMIEDIFKSYSYQAEDITLINTDKPEHAWKVKLLDKVSNHYMKSITRGNDLYSTIVTRNLTGQLLQLLHSFQQNKDKQGKGKGGSGAGGQWTLSDLMGEMGDADFEAAVQKAMDEASQQISNVETSLEQMVGSKQAGKMATDIKTLEVLAQIDLFSKIMPIRPEQLSKFIKGCYKRIVSYYNPHAEMYEEPFLEAESVEGMDELEQLLPIFKLANLEDLVIQSYKFSFKFDIYIDASGSMTSMIKIGEHHISLYDLCRYLTVKLNAMGLIKNIYLFETSVRKVKDVFELMTINWGGGTDFNAVLTNIDKTGMSSVILTDLCDRISRHNKSCYFIGIQTFQPQGDESTIKSYAANKQFMLFTDKGEFKIPKKGVDY